MALARQWLVVLVLGLSLVWTAPQPDLLLSQPGAAGLLQSTTLSLVSPSACPAADCAPGQRLNLRFDFELSAYDPTPTDPPQPNVKVCFYTPTNWINPASLNATDQNGGVTGQAYSLVSDCAEDDAPPTGYSLSAAWQTNLTSNAFSDSLTLAFRIASSANASGKVLARLFERTSTGWQRSQQAFTANLGVTSAASAIFYVAGTPSQCDTGGYQPCYVNSGDDLAEGIGTGLKDAVDNSQPGGIVYLVGSYPIKSNAVSITSAIQLTGIDGASLTSTSSVCTNSMLMIKEGVILRNLAINDGLNCSSANRTLIEVNSAKDVLIESNQLSSGDRAIWVRDNTGGVTVRFNQIENNAAQAVFWDTGTIFAPLVVEGNNIVGNGASTSGVQMECASGLNGVAASRKANHNYWGSPAAPDQNTIHCTATSGKQLGAPIRPAPSSYGVDAQRVTVGVGKTYTFNNQIAFQRTSSSSDFEIYIVNHGYAQNDYIPFGLDGGLNPCSNYWDIFLPDGVSPSGTLELYFSYANSAACIAAINSSLYCDQTTDTTKYPLWWYDPGTDVTDGWDTTGQDPDGTNAGSGSGQTTTCRMTNNEIQVSIDSSGRPNLANDLSYLPIFAGIQVLKSYQLSSSNNNVTINWATNTEPDVTGFIIERSLDSVNFNPITDLIARKGSALSGSTYQFVDSGRTTDQTYYYRLRIARPDGNVLYSDVLSVVGTSATATRTLTPTRTNIGGATSTSTRTAGPSPTRTPPPPTRTRTPTRVPAQNPTRAPSATRTSRPATPTRAGLTLPTGSVTALSGTPEPDLSRAVSTGYPVETGASDGTSYPVGNEATSANGYPAPGDGTPDVETTPGHPYPAPGDLTLTPDGTAIAGLPEATTTPGGPAQGETPGKFHFPTQWVALSAGLSGGMTLLGLLALWLLVIRKKPTS